MLTLYSQLAKHSLINSLGVVFKINGVKYIPVLTVRDWKEEINVNGSSVSILAS